MFFRAGIIGKLEELRDEKLTFIFKLVQARMRGLLMRKEYKKMIERRWVCVLYSTLKKNEVAIAAL